MSTQLQKPFLTTKFLFSGKKAQGLTCPEGTYESCGWSFLVSLPG